MTLREAVSAMERGDAEAALPVLEEALLDTNVPPPVRARVLGLNAQALLMLGRLDHAKMAVREALRAARELGDARGLQQLRGLNGQIYAALAQHAEQQRRLQCTKPWRQSW